MDCTIFHSGSTDFTKTIVGDAVVRFPSLRFRLHSDCGSQNYGYVMGDSAFCPTDWLADIPDFRLKCREVDGKLPKKVGKLQSFFI